MIYKERAFWPADNGEGGGRLLFYELKAIAASLLTYSPQLHANELILHLHTLCASLLCACGVIKGAIMTRL